MIDAGAIVDPQLCVIGVDGLRIADAAMMPSILGGNTNAPTMMIAEKAGPDSGARWPARLDLREPVVR